MTDESTRETARRRPPARPDVRLRKGTATREFGASRRENHDASDFYARFTPPAITTDDVVNPVPEALLSDPIKVGDSRTIGQVLPANSVALMVTSPPYFVGKEYELAVTGDADTLDSAPSVPTNYLEYLEMLHDVFAACLDVLEPGGKMAINVANLGRKPYRSLSADVISILQDDLGMLLRGEIIWQKAEGATGSVAWGSYRKATNPVLRDLTERVIIASKGRFDRAIPKGREEKGYPHESTLSADDFMEATLDVWKIAPESARRVQHPAPFPLELPRRLIDLYTYRGDVVLDPFLGSGTTLVAAERTGRRGIGFDLDPAYADIARTRLEAERRRPKVRPIQVDGEDPLPMALPDTTEERIEHFQARATIEGKKAADIAEQVLIAAGFEIVKEQPKLSKLGVQFNFLVASAEGHQYYVDVSGAFTTVRPGLMRTDTMWKLLGRVHVLKAQEDPVDPSRVLVLTSNLPKAGSEGDKALRAVGPTQVFDAIEMFDDGGGVTRLAEYGSGRSTRPLPGFWTEADIETFEQAERLA
ncbi:MAG: site-specific DNA-methyltransferase [Acidimicrobiia bacterium]|nr:site-specific DNA-methyltransferase [Acidimicrobiia bacterium]